MRLLAYFFMTTAFMNVCTIAQDDAPKPAVSKAPLTTEQVAVYRALLSDYMKDSQGTLNLSNQTEPLDLKASLAEGCVGKLQLEGSDRSDSIVHEIPNATKLLPNVVLVDPQQQEAKVKQNDPQQLIKKALEGGPRPTDEQMDNSLKLAFSTGLFSFSEIVFDKAHRHALVSYSFVCGGLCGHGNTLLLEKAKNTWKIKKTCSSWVS